MELTESIDSINRQLADLFGRDIVTNQPIWRVVWSEDQREKRLMNVTKEGLHLLTPTVMEVRKYQYIKEKYILEQLVQVPDFQQAELGGAKISYEPMFVFETKKGEYLPPRVDVAKIVIDTVYSFKGKTNMAKYIEKKEDLEKEIDELVEYLWDPSDTADAIVAGEGVVVPHNYTTQDKE